MFSFLDKWWIVFYPDSWVEKPGIVITLFVIGVLCIPGIVWATKQLRKIRNNKRWKVCLAVVVWILFVWALPALILGIIELVLAVLALIFVLLLIGFLFWAITGGFSDDTREGSEKDKYIIKKEDGKEVIYEEGLLFDRKVGDLHNELGGSKETRNIFGPNVKVQKESGLSKERRGEIGNQKGVFEKRGFDKYPTFKPDEKSEED